MCWALCEASDFGTADANCCKSPNERCKDTSYDGNCTGGAIKDVGGTCAATKCKASDFAQLLQTAAKHLLKSAALLPLTASAQKVLSRTTQAHVLGLYVRPAISAQLIQTAAKKNLLRSAKKVD